MDKSDTTLIREYLSGQAESFDELYERYRRGLYGYLQTLTASASDADDLFQQTWLRVLDKLPEYDDRNKFGAWLFRIAHNLVMDKFRKDRKTRATITLDDPDSPVAELPSATPEAWGAMQNRELGEALHQALTELSPEQKEVFLLRQEAISFKEIAAMQRSSINTALARMQYAIKKLQKRLESWK